MACNGTVPNSPKTPLRSIRVPDPLWKAAQERAAERGESVSDVIRAALERYVKSKTRRET
jgi:Arc/MetJ-type ribon-helix-helix transcriptional regulator